MADCSKLEGCPFFNNKLSNMPSTAEGIKKMYCRNDYENCARYRISTKLGKEHVPEGLFPHQKEVADELLK